MTLSVQNSCRLDGWFDFSVGRITGWAANVLEPHDSDLTIHVIHGRSVIAAARVHERAAGVGWRFDIDIGSKVSSEDVLHERVRVLVSDAAGDTKVLRLEGATQLALIHELLPGGAPTLLDIDFREGGNSADFVLAGWSGQEQTHRWTIGAESRLILPPSLVLSDIMLEISLWPFIVADVLTSQRLQIIAADIVVGDFSVAHQAFLRCRRLRPAEPPGSEYLIRLIHPDAASPASLNVSDDTRLLAHAFKRIRILPAAA